MTNYSIGATWERKVAHKLLEQGAISVVRAAGSKSYGKGKIDLIALFKDKVWLIQCKRHGLISWKEKEEGLEIGEILSPYAYSILAYYKGGMRFTEFKDFFVKEKGDELLKQKEY